MKKIVKTMSIFFCLFAAMLLIQPMQALAGGIWAEINVRYVELRADGGITNCDTPLESDYIGISAELTCPDGQVMTDTIEKVSSIGYSDGKKTAIGEHRFFIANETDVSKMIAGTYTLTKFDCPKGYEYDNAMESKYPLSVTITQSDINDYVAWAGNLNEADGKVFQIYVPVKKIGTMSAALQKPEKAELSIGRENLYVEPKNYNGTYSLEFQYAAKANGTYQTLKSSDSTYFFSQEGCPLKHGKTYYMRARYYKTVNGSKVYGDYGSAVKVTVSKSTVVSYKPAVSLKNNKTRLAVSSTGERSFNYKISYAAKKNGKYKEIAQSYMAPEIQLTAIKQLKKGKTYYIRVRFVDEVNSEKIYGPYSKVVKVKIK